MAGNESVPEMVCRVCKKSKPVGQFRVKLNGKRNTGCVGCLSRSSFNPRTPDGYLCRVYGNMKKRVEGRENAKRHRRLYTGLALLSREDFIVWAKDDANFWRLYRRWEAAGYDYKLSPSINRIDPDRGYELGNLEWLTHSVNSALARPRMQTVLQRIHDSVAA